MTTVAFLGLGRMGLPLAHRLLDRGCYLRVFNRTPERAESLITRGAVRCTTPRDACSDAEAVISMVSDDEASRAIWLGPDAALLGAVKPGALAIECSTLSHDWVLDISSHAAAHGFRYIDCPVTGLPDMAAAGELTLLVGADPTDLDTARPLLATFSNRILHFGSVGSGTAYKLLVNLLGAVQIASAAETLAVAERVGLDLQSVVHALGTGQAASPQVVRNTRRMLESSHDQNVVFTPELRLKDVEYALALARKFGIGSPFGALAASLLRQLCALGYRHCNESSVIEVARIQSPDA
jgi:3-hydroxyisobutyrate dehydrogenase